MSISRLEIFSYQNVNYSEDRNSANCVYNAPLGIPQIVRVAIRPTDAYVIDKCDRELIAQQFISVRPTKQVCHRLANEIITALILAPKTRQKDHGSADFFSACHDLIKTTARVQFSGTFSGTFFFDWQYSVFFTPTRSNYRSGKRGKMSIFIHTALPRSEQISSQIDVECRANCYFRSFLSLGNDSCAAHLLRRDLYSATGQGIQFDWRKSMF